MSDLGDIILVNRPLIIREAKLGGRKLTKALFMQLPILEDCLPLKGEDTEIVAWVNYHWADCDDERLNYSDEDLSHQHRHLLVRFRDTAMRCTVWSPRYGKTIQLHSDNSRVAQALVLRQILDGRLKEYRVEREMRLSHEGYIFNYYLTPAVYDNLQNLGYRPEGKEQLVTYTLIDDSWEDLLGVLTKERIATETFRSDLAEQWRLVTEETPQVFL